jgi:hypothetical protein
LRDGQVTAGEQCDNGPANCDPQASDCYNQCTTVCTLGPYCGDRIVQAQDGEQCDNGSNTDSYGVSSGCAPGCVLPARCGDGKLQLAYGEQCDDGPSNCDPRSSSCYGQCTTACQLGPYCGDGIPNGPEACDDGVNDGTYATCGNPGSPLPNCELPPRCGDGVVQTEWGEECEPTASDDPNCTAACRKPGGCGDGSG